MHTRRIGGQGLECGAIGLGCMGMSNVSGPADDEESIRTIHRSLALGMSMLDTADVYGFNANEALIGKALQGRRDEAVIATKFGMKRRPDGTLVGIDGSPEYVAEACDASLRRLAVDTIDLYYAHRLDPKVPVEETVGAMSRLVEAGKVRFIGLSEASPENIRRAHAVHPVSALQSEYSLWTRDPEDDVLPLLSALDIGFVAYSPLGRGMLTGTIRSQDDLAERDYRRTFPRYEEGNLERNAALVEALELLAEVRGVTVAQLCLAWLLAQPAGVVPIAGTKRVRWAEQNAAAADITLEADEIAAIDAAFDAGAVVGERFRPAAMQRLGQNSPEKT
jgi:aryl-alcohol dehydrogenase-like predicted oxidoreductase